MNADRRIIELLVLGACAFVLSRALLSFVLGPGDTPTEGNWVWQLILAACYLGVVLLLVPFYREALYAARRNRALMGLVVLALVSCLWAAMPELVLRRSVAVLGTTLFGLALAVRLSLHDQLRFFSLMFRCLAVLSLACVVLAPGYGVSDWVVNSGEWRGIFDHKNGLGSAMALSILVEWYLPVFTPLSRLCNRGAIVLSAVLLYFSHSITPVVALLGTLVAIEIYKFSTRQLRVPLYALVSTAAGCVAVIVVAFLTQTEKVTGLLGRSSDLTGRTEIWSWVVSFINLRPIWGYGYSGFWSGASPESVVIDRTMGTMIMYSHNGYLEILLTLGMVGLVLTLSFLVTGVKRAWFRSRLGHMNVDIWPLAFLTYLLFHNIGECTILFQDLEWALCVATVVGSDPMLFAFEEEQDPAFALLLAEEFK